MPSICSWCICHVSAYRSWSSCFSAPSQLHPIKNGKYITFWDPGTRYPLGTWHSLCWRQCLDVQSQDDTVITLTRCTSGHFSMPNCYSQYDMAVTRRHLLDTRYRLHLWNFGYGVACSPLSLQCIVISNSNTFYYKASEMHYKQPSIRNLGLYNLHYLKLWQPLWELVIFVLGCRALLCLHSLVLSQISSVFLTKGSSTIVIIIGRISSHSLKSDCERDTWCRGKFLGVTFA